MRKETIKKHVKRWLPIGIIAALMIIAYFFGVYNYLDFDMLREKRFAALAYLEKHPILTPLIFICIYVIAAALSLPITFFLTLASGFLFPQPLCLIYVIAGGSIGAIIIFVAAKTALKDFFYRKAGPFLTKIKKKFQDNAIYYMLFFRLTPFFPFWLANITPAFFQVKLSSFIWTTVIGMIPVNFAFTQTGAGLGEMFDSNLDLTLANVFNWKVKIALIAIAVFALFPIIIKIIINRRHKKNRKHKKV